jgi:quinol monooxygenase YgiN
MINVILQMSVSPERREDFIELVKGISEPTRVLKGCTSYYLGQSVEEENMFFVVEEWESQRDLENFIQSDTYRRLLLAMELLSRPPEVKINVISYTGGLEAIRAARERRSMTK